jgi:ABC-type uncharacterized transport system substrate-binding protein
LAQDSPGAVFSWGGSKQFLYRQTICEWASKAALPTLALSAEYVQAGCLIAYGPSLPHLFREAAGYVDRILKGQSGGIASVTAVKIY